MGKSTIPFRDSASLGKRMEYLIMSKLLNEGFDVYVPLVDDHGVDAVVALPDGRFARLQIKARGDSVNFGDAALFANIRHNETLQNYWYIFYSDRMKYMWLFSADEFVAESNENKTGNNVGKRSIWLNGKDSKSNTEHCKPQFEKYIVENFKRLLDS